MQRSEPFHIRFFAVEGIEAQGGKAFAVQADIAKLEDIRRLFRETIRHLDRLDIVVANTGYSCFKPML
jgi:3-oxoacyl-[acyl-carrier protein] reductase